MKHYLLLFTLFLGLFTVSACRVDSPAPADAQSVEVAQNTEVEPVEVSYCVGPNICTANKNTCCDTHVGGCGVGRKRCCHHSGAACTAAHANLCCTRFCVGGTHCF
jgi:hypothetical protein